MRLTNPRAPRTDCHRPGAIIPADYRYLFSFNLATSMGGWPLPACGVNCELDGRRIVDGKVINGSHRADGECCCIGVRDRHACTGRNHGPGKCSVCGAAFVYGDCWLHVPSGKVIFLGHDCADKYALLADRSAWERADGQARRMLAVEIEKAQRAEERAEFLADHPGLEEALKGDHDILRDMAARFKARRYLSPKQVAFALRLADEAKNPKPEETFVAAPTGKVIFRGEVVSLKSKETMYGTQLKLTVKVHTPEGVWLAWGTCPAALDRALPENPRGCEIEITATLKQGRDAHFALMSRPKGRLLAGMATA